LFESPQSAMAPTGKFQLKTTASASRLNTPNRSSVFLRGCMAPINTRAPASDSPSARRSSNAMAAASGSNRKRVKARGFTSRFRQRNREVKRRSNYRLGFQPDPAAVRFDNFAGERET